MYSHSFHLKYLPLPNGETYAYREINLNLKPNPNVILLLHGNMCSSIFFDTLAPILAKEFKVICPDIRGFGHSSYNKRINKHEDLVEDLILFIDALGITQFTILGWSTGGAIASLFAAKYPKYVQSLILLCSIEPNGFQIQAHSTTSTTAASGSTDGSSGGGGSTSGTNGTNGGTSGDSDANGAETNINRKPYQTPETLLTDPSVIYFMDMLARKDRAALKMIIDTMVYIHNKPNESRYERYLDEVVLQRNLGDIAIANHFFDITSEEDTEEEPKEEAKVKTRAEMIVTKEACPKGRGLANRIQAKTLIFHGEKDLMIPPSDSWLKVLRRGRTGAGGREGQEGIGEGQEGGEVKVKWKVFKNCGHSPVEDCLDELANDIIGFVKEM